MNEEKKLISDNKEGSGMRKRRVMMEREMEGDEGVREEGVMKEREKEE